jgi:glycosyltransferase involved in cell wall biosynthesis
MKKRVEITMPVYNEEKALEESITKVVEFCKKEFNKKYLWHVTIADNASTDNTPIIATNLAKTFAEVSTYRLEQKGRGRALKRVWSESTAEYCSYMDIDLSTDIIHLPKLYDALDKGYDMAVGSRLKKTSWVEKRTLLREITSRGLNFICIRLFFRTKFSDAQCGFKAVTRDVVENLIPKVLDNSWFFDGELLIVGEKSGYKIYEEPVHWVDDPGSTVKLLPTIIGDLKVMLRLLRTMPWKTIQKK